MSAKAQDRSIWPLGVEGATSIGAPRTVSFTVATPLGDARRSAGVWMGGSSGSCALAPLPRLAGVTLARDWLWGVNTPCQRVKWARGLGPRAIQPHLALLGELDLAESVPAGCARMASWVGPPPRPTVPPRPWNRRIRAPCSVPSEITRCCARYSSHDDATMPPYDSCLFITPWIKPNCIHCAISVACNSR